MTKQDVRQGIDTALNDLERLADEVRVKLHLAEMDAKDRWEKTLEPRLFEARAHAKEASDASKAAIEATLKAFRDFAQGM